MQETVIAPRGWYRRPHVAPLVLALALALLLGLLSRPAQSAPVPFRLAPPPPDRRIVGSWVIHWRGGTGQATFHRQGGFTCMWCGQKWIGWYEVKDGVLTVTEAVEPSFQAWHMPNWYTWKASLDADGLGGRLPTGGRFTLTPVRATGKRAAAGKVEVVD